VPLQHVVASDLAPMVQRLAEGGAATPGHGAGWRRHVHGDGRLARSNSLILRAATRRAGQVRASMARLDRPARAAAPAGSMWVVHLKNADATKLAQVLRAAFAAAAAPPAGGGSRRRPPAAIPAGHGQQCGHVPPGQRPTAAGSAQATAPVASVAQPSTGGFIQADPATNSLIITAPEPLYRQVRAMIDQLDTRRAQVYIESMIVEVDADNAAEFGFQWQGLLGNGEQGGRAAGTNFSGHRRQHHRLINTPAAAGAAAIAGAGLNIGLLRNQRRVLRWPPSRACCRRRPDQHRQHAQPDHARQRGGQDRRRRERALHHRPVHQHRHRHDQPLPDHRAQGRRHHAAHPPQIGEGGTMRMRSTRSSRRQAHHRHRHQQCRPDHHQALDRVHGGGGRRRILVLGGLIEDRFEPTQSKVPLLGDIPLLGASSAARAASASAPT
jgi:general secretion pathway protein D